MKNIKFEKREASRASKVFMVVTYMGGDADTYHPEEYLLPFSFDDYKNHLEEIGQDLDKYKILKKLTDGSGGQQDHNYDDLEKKYGEEIASLYDNIPNDPQSDFQFKTSLDSVMLRGYDSEGAMYEAYLM